MRCKPALNTCVHQPCNEGTRPDEAPLDAGRMPRATASSVYGVLTAEAPPARGGGERAFVTNAEGKVILDITKDRVKTVIPGQGFGPKRAPTAEELGWLQQLLGGG